MLDFPICQHIADLVLELTLFSWRDDISYTYRKHKFLAR